MQVVKTIARRATSASRRWRAVMESAKKVQRIHGKGVWRQVREMVALRLGPGRVAPHEYYDMGLYADTYDAGAQRAFVGDQRNREIDRLVNNPQWRAVADSKLVCSAMLTGVGLPTPRTLALYRPGVRSLPRLRCLHTSGALADFLRNESMYPAFAKPVRSHLGKGAFILRAYDRGQDSLFLDHGRTCAVDAFVEMVDGFQNTARYGYLFQEPIRQHPVFERAWGSCVGSMRMVVALDTDGPRLLRVILRVPRVNAITDNLVGATSGNMAAAVQLSAGVVERVIAGTGLGQRELDSHPDTGVPLRGMTIPLWQECVDTVFDAALLLPGLQLQHWDVAVGPEGPILIEVNYAGGAIVSQAACGAGMLSPDLVEFVARHGRHYHVQ